jgi:uncharacterized repeat protein (TIGR03833 family)
MSEKRNGRLRSSVTIGSTVDIVQKQDRESGKKSRGIVAEILTSSPSHPHGIKVRLRDGKVGRVEAVLGNQGERSPR